MDEAVTLKLTTLGEGRVGKSSLIFRYHADKFDPTSPPTITASFFEKRVNLDGRSIVVNLWDTAGQERFHALGPIYYRDTDCALLVFDVTDTESFVKIKRWINELRSLVAEDLPICIAGNKWDLAKDKTIDVEECEQYANDAGVKLFWTSALTGKNVEECFVYLVRVAAERAQTLRARASSKDEDDKLIISEYQARKERADQNQGECCI